MGSSIKTGRTVAKKTQCILLVCSLAGLLYEYGYRPKFPDEPAGLGMALQMLPNLVLVIALVRQFSLASWIGLVAATVALTWRLPDVSGHTFGPLLGTLFPALWVITASALLRDVFLDKATTKRVTGFLARNIAGLLLISILPLMFAVPVAAMFGLGSRSSRAECNEAPQADFETRRAWGEKEYPRYLKDVGQFAATSKMIRDDIGRVMKIAPVGSPNLKEHGFMDELSLIHI